MNQSLSTLLEDAQRKLDQQQYDAAADMVRRVLEIEPRNTLALNGLAVILLMMMKADEAESYALLALQEDQTPTHFITLGDIKRTKRDYLKAREYYMQALDIEPENAKALSGLGEVYERAGYRPLAIEYYEAAVLQSGSFDMFLQYGKLLSYRDAPHMLDVLTRIPPPAGASFKHQFYYEMERIILKERAERVSHDLMEMASSSHELSFHFAKPERDAFEAMIDRARLQDPNLQSKDFGHPYAFAKAMCLVSRGDGKAAQPYFEYLAQIEPHQIYANVIAEPDFYRALEAQSDAALFAGFAPVEDIQTAVFADKPIVLLSSDYRYFLQFTRPLLSSIQALSPGTQIQLHIVNPPSEGLQKILSFCAKLPQLRIAISIEQTATPSREYYHAIRFIRLYQFLKRYERTVCVLDVDALLHKDIGPLLQSVGNSDVGVSGHPGLWAIWNQFRAGIVAVNPTERGCAYARLVAGYIASFSAAAKLRWGIDQLALYLAYLFLCNDQRAPQMKFFTELLFDVECRDEALIWCKGGTGKYDRVVQLEHESVPFEVARLKYDEALRQLGYKV